MAGEGDGHCQVFVQPYLICHQPAWLVAFLKGLSRGFVKGQPPVTSQACVFSQRTRCCQGVVIVVEIEHCRTLSLSVIWVMRWWPEKSRWLWTKGTFTVIQYDTLLLLESHNQYIALLWISSENYSGNCILLDFFRKFHSVVIPSWRPQTSPYRVETVESALAFVHGIILCNSHHRWSSQISPSLLYSSQYFP